jgi:hypothetical protein
VLWPLSETPRDRGPDVSADPAMASVRDLDAPAPSSIGRAHERIQLGLDAEDVERLAGPPLFRSPDRWEYGPSEIRFTEGKVSGWYSSPLRPLPVADIANYPEPRRQ